MSPDENFELNVKDIELIENSLRHYMNHLQLHGQPENAMYIYELMGRIHNQKIWYRPRKKDYVSG